MVQEQQANNINVLIGLPSHDGGFNIDMQKSLDAMIKYSYGQGINLAVHKQYGSMLCANRNNIVRKALSVEEFRATHLLFIDSDMVFDQTALEQLVKHDRDVVSGLAVLKKPPFDPVVKKRDKDGNYTVMDNLDEGRFFSDVDGVGCAFMLIKTSVLEKIEPPWFAMPPYGTEVMGEDFYFCEKVKAADIDICVDTSLNIGHIGTYPYTINDYLEYKAERERREKEEADD